MRRMHWFLPLIALTMLALGLRIPNVRAQAAAPTPNAQPDLPPGPGRDTFQHICSSCHVTSVATTQRKSADDWAGIVDDMRSRGANGTDADFEQIVQYLATNFGPASSTRVNINTAAADALASALGLTKAEAEAIVQYRTEKGPFKDVDAVKQVPGIDAAKVDAAKDRIDF
ncbi:MAG TPA: helix-hairpin-helix domain-containing protein [Granulicella sp.]